MHYMFWETQTLSSVIALLHNPLSISEISTLQYGPIKKKKKRWNFNLMLQNCWTLINRKPTWTLSDLMANWNYVFPLNVWSIQNLVSIHFRICDKQTASLRFPKNHENNMFE